MTIGAPPSTLRKLIDYLEKKSNSSKKLNPHRVHIYAPYHAPRLYSKENILKVLDDLPSLDEAFDSNELASEKRTLIGAVSGEFYSASSRRNLLEQVLYNVLSEPIYWERVLDGCKSHVGSSQFSNWVVRPFGPANAAQSLVATLKAEGNVEVHFDEDFGSVSDDSAKPQKPPLAIVGMAGRFPESNSPDELWKILEDGLDCHKVVSKSSGGTLQFFTELLDTYRQVQCRDPSVQGPIRMFHEDSRQSRCSIFQPFPSRGLANRSWATPCSCNGV